jgi:hypothetical protein
VLGPLPTIYKVVVFGCALAAFVGIGAWVSYLLPESFLVAVGASIGAGIGIVAGLLLLHDFHHHTGSERVRVRSARRH